MHLGRFGCCACILMLLFCIEYSSAEFHLQSFPVAYMNITPDRDEVGFIQLFAVSTNVSLVSIQTLHELSHIDLTNGPADRYINVTLNYDRLNIIHETNPSAYYKMRLAVLVSASSETDVHVYGVKSDKGTTDGFLALPLTRQSKQFFIATWDCTHPQFFGALQIVAPLEDTCVEIYRVNGDDFQLENEQYLDTTFDTFTYVSSAPGVTNGTATDLTGYFVNSSKPIAIFAGHACAFVPQGVFFCDHVVEQIRPVYELGTEYIVPPIIGRDPDAGYVIRVVSASLEHNETRVEWETANGAMTGSQVVARGQFVELYNPSATQPMKVECSSRCLVMMYNTGRNTVPGRSDPVPTDPFMVDIVPWENSDNASGYATPSFCDIVDGTQYRQEFSNQLAIITLRSDTEAIRFDGRSVAQWSRAWNYAYAAFPVSHGAHYITVKRGSDARFTAYAYGHSIVETSSGAYGFTVSYTARGDYYSDLRSEPLENMERNANRRLSSDCKQERILSGSAVARHPSATNPQVLKHPIPLYADAESPPMSSACREQYRLTLVAALLDQSRLINELICNGTMCPYIAGAPGAGVPVNESAIVGRHFVFAAIDTASLPDAVTLDVDGSTGSISTVYVDVPYTGITDTTAATFAKCRVEVRDFLQHSATPSTLMPPAAGCPTVTFADDMFTKRSVVCTLPQ